MNTRLVTTAALVLGLLAAVPALAQTATPTKVGAVNLIKVINSMQEFKDMNTKLEADANSLKTLTDTHQADLANLQQQMRNGPKPGTSQYDELVQNFDKKRVEYEIDLQEKKLELARTRTRQLRSVYTEIAATVGDLAKQKGLDLVINSINPDFPDNSDELTPEQMQTLINQHNVLFVSGSIDITSEAITALDAKYKAGAK